MLNLVVIKLPISCVIFENTTGVIKTGLIKTGNEHESLDW